MGSIQEEITVADMLRDERQDNAITFIQSLKKFGVFRDSVLEELCKGFKFDNATALDLVNKYY